MTMFTREYHDRINKHYRSVQNDILKFNVPFNNISIISRWSVLLM